ncbi:MAG: GGDEF domain-containing protein [Elusimicrobiota bacterium]|nr:GGDEF domain-containing protein [Endomicrobiia bacterium]MDW8165823.1 GGDEF domain-containing protein [Elusimicrobiota bacterium]
MPKEIIFNILVLFSYVVIECLFSFLYSKYKYEIIFAISLLSLFVLYLITPAYKEFFIIPFIIILLVISYNLNEDYKKQKIESSFLPKIEELKKRLEEDSKRRQEIFSQWEDLERDMSKTFNMFYMVEEINKNLSIEKIIKEVYDLIKNTYPNTIKYIGLIKSSKKETTSIIEYPEHKEYVNKLQLNNITKDIVIFGDFNIYVFNFSFNGDELKILIEYEPLKNDIEFLEFVDFIFSKIRLTLRRSILFKEIEELSRIDGLTSLYLRRYIIKKLQEETIRAYRYNTVYSVLMIDIDFFKKINDTYGHLIGDKVLVELSKLFQETIKGKGLISRWGGEEFLILLPYTDKKTAHKIAEELRKKVEDNKFYLDSFVINFTISIGISTFPEDGIDFNQIITVADSMLYEAKKLGRNKVVSSVV